MQAHYYAEYDQIEEHHWWFRARRTILRAVLEAAGLWQKGQSALDVGTGTGRMLGFLAEGMRGVYGLDREPEALGFVVERGRARPGCLIRSSATSLPIRSASLDLVTAFDLVEHLEDDLGAVVELGRVVRPGGHLVLTVPALRSLWSQHDVLNQHLRRYRLGEIVSLLHQADLDLVRASYFNTLLLPLIAAMRLGQRLAGRFTDVTRRDAEGRLQSDFSILPSPLVSRGFEALMALEAPLLRHIDLPLGVSIVAIGRRP